MRAIFFVNPAFAETSGDDARRFFTTRIRPAEDAGSFSEEDVTPMPPATLRSLRRRGHLIGNHTRSHEDLRRVSGSALEAEIRGGRDTLADWLGEPVECFAWTFAWNAITAEAWTLAGVTHRYCFSACPGTNTGPERSRVWRTNTEDELPPHAYRFFYSGLADGVWWRRRRRLAALHASLVWS